jgi:uncharacterized membrane protein (DUF2068 family)
MKREIGLEAIIAYKLVKAVAEALLGALAIYLVIRGPEAGAATLAESILEHVGAGWALRVATFVVKIGTKKHVEMLAVVSLGDAVLSAVEGLALRAGRWWAPWLVVIATGSLLPWELLEILAHPRWTRLALLVINLAVVAYLMRRVLRERSAPPA